MDPTLAESLADLALGSLTTNLSLAIIGALFYGVSILIFGRAIYIFRQRGVKGKAVKLNLVATILCFSLFTIASVSNFSPLVWDLKLILDVTTNDIDAAADSNNHKTFVDVVLMQWAEDLMYCVSDILVVWRASVLLPGKLWVAAVLIALWLCNFALSIASSILNSNFSTWMKTNAYSPDTLLWYHLTDAGTGLSLGLNLLTTILIGVRMWYHRRDLASSGMRLKGPNSGGPMILVWLVEAGLAFSLLQLINFLLQQGIARSSNVALVSRLDYAAWFFGCLFDLVTGVYPAVIVIMVDMQKSLMEVLEEASSVKDTTTYPTSISG